MFLFTWLMVLEVVVTFDITFDGWQYLMEAEGWGRPQAVRGEERRKPRNIQLHSWPPSLSHLCCHLVPGIKDTGTWNQLSDPTGFNPWFLQASVLNTSVYLSPGWTSWGDETRCWWETQAGVQVWLIRSGSVYIVHGSFVQTPNPNCFLVIASLKQ